MPSKPKKQIPEEIIADIPLPGPDALPPELYINREVSWLAFNERVLEEAQDKSNPVFERLKFLSITSSNLDEFFMVRVSGLLALVRSGFDRRDPSGMRPEEQLEKISEICHGIIQRQYNCYSRALLPLLEKEGMEYCGEADLTSGETDFVARYFNHTLYPILTPMAIDQGRPFPLLANRSLNIMIELEPDDGPDGEERYAVVQAPAVVQRLLELEPSGEQAGQRFIFVEEIIKAHAWRLFPGYKINSSHCFRITRNSDLELDEEDAEDLLSEIEQSVKQRKWGEPVRLEIEKGMETRMREFLVESLELTEREIYEISGPIDLTFLMPFSGRRGHERLKYKQFVPQTPPAFIDKHPFEAVRAGDILVHHPYESFDCVLAYVREAAGDPQVLAIKQTLYRVSGNSPIVAALISAAENGKQVTVLVELKARFDEENNILWAKKLEHAGCHVVYGLVGLKIHCKLCLVVRREDDGGILRYVHMSTGNYNDSTARIYTDMGFFTVRESFGQDVSALFNVLTGYSANPRWNKLAVAPATLRPLFEKMINSEIEIAKSGGEALIMIKINALVDAGMIKLLYAAGAAGVKVRLLVRGICCLRAGVPGVSENISVTSIVDRFLEHSRMYYFHNNGNPNVYLSSADMMPRNLDRRVEVAFPIEDAELKNRIIEAFEISFSDTVKARELQPDGTYDRVDKRGKKNVRSQQLFIDAAAEKYAEATAVSEAERFRPNVISARTIN